MLSPTRSKCGKAVYLTLHLLCSAGLLFWIILKHLKVIFVLLFFSSCGTDNKKRNCLIEKNLARTFITNIVWARGKMLFTVFFYVENFQWHSSFTNRWNKNWTACLTYLNISASAHLKNYLTTFFCQTLTYCHSNVYVCLWLKLK